MNKDLDICFDYMTKEAFVSSVMSLGGSVLDRLISTPKDVSGVLHSIIMLSAIPGLIVGSAAGYLASTLTSPTEKDIDTLQTDLLLAKMKGAVADRYRELSLLNKMKKFPKIEVGV